MSCFSGWPPWGHPFHGLGAVLWLAAAGLLLWGALALLRPRPRRVAAEESFCAGCGAGLRSGWRYCPGCGSEPRARPKAP